MSANEHIESVVLELIRPGPTHGQLLSPLTSYLALCGDDSPVTLQINFEHWRLLNRLERLRYTTRDGRRGMTAVPDSSRESEVAELGRDVGAIFAAIPTLGRELGRAAGQGSRLVHLRMVISGSELSLLPFELLISPTGYPGTGRPLLLQPQTPIVITREVRRGDDSNPVKWNHKPRILFISAAPGNMHVPTREHVQALRRVIEPWVWWADDPKERLAFVREHLTVLTDATIGKIQGECAKHSYTHVHILAHGGSYPDSGQTRYGLVLCDDDKPGAALVVDGERLAEALHVKLANTSGSSNPVLVSLATCDAGNVGSVVAPGGSIAHDLHAHGVPWVFASQFPLTKRGSVKLTEHLYGGLLDGQDPRLLLERLRLNLHVTRRHDHDWASLVAYASAPENLRADVEMFRSHQHQRAIDVDLNRANHYQDVADKAIKNEDMESAAKLQGEFQDALARARTRIRRWKDQLPQGEEDWAMQARVECFGVEGATEKKLAQCYHDAGKKNQADGALRASLAAYGDALQAKPNAHWPATQHLALSAILDQGENPDRWTNIREIAKGQLVVAQGQDKAWAHGTLAELELLSVYHVPARSSAEEVTAEVTQHCEEIRRIVGWDDFAVLSTRRQFQRYVSWWKKDVWSDIASAAVACLTRESGADSSD
jgi:hypothetical protein